MSRDAASPVRIGMKADEVLKLRGRSKQFATKMPTFEGKDEQGWPMAGWHYQDCMVILHKRQGCMRVKEVLYEV